MTLRNSYILQLYDINLDRKNYSFLFAVTIQSYVPNLLFSYSMRHYFRMYFYAYNLVICDVNTNFCAIL